MDFLVLDMESNKETLILRRPFLRTVEAYIDVGARVIHFCINDKEEKFKFCLKREECSMIKVKYGPNEKNITEVKVTPEKKDNLVEFLLRFLDKENPTPTKKTTIVRLGLWVKKQHARSKKTPTTPQPKPKMK